ncbi:MAG: hypothetical protein WCK05_04740 [Planctomycetota bacterium]
MPLDGPGAQLDQRSLEAQIGDGPDGVVNIARALAVDGGQGGGF